MGSLCKVWAAIGSLSDYLKNNEIVLIYHYDNDEGTFP